MIKPADILILFLCIGTAFGGTIVIKGPMAAASITCSGTCWSDVNCNSATFCTATSSTQTLTVPSGSGGTVKFNGGFVHTVNYSKNGGASTGVADGGTVVFANGDTLAISITHLNAGSDSDTVTVTDNTTGAVIGTFTGTNIHA